jgi:hypothetical protein
MGDVRRRDVRRRGTGILTFVEPVETFGNYPFGSPGIKGFFFREMRLTMSWMPR